MDYILSMVFTTTGGKTTTLSINGVKSTITQAEILALMDIIIAKNVFAVDSGTLVGRDTAKVTQRKITEYDVA